MISPNFLFLLWIITITVSDVINLWHGFLKLWATPPGGTERDWRGRGLA